MRGSTTHHRTPHEEVQRGIHHLRSKQNEAKTHIAVGTGLVGADIYAGVAVVCAAHGRQRRAGPRRGTVDGGHQVADLFNRAALRVVAVKYGGSTALARDTGGS